MISLITLCFRAIFVGRAEKHCCFPAIFVGRAVQHRCSLNEPPRSIHQQDHHPSADSSDKMKRKAHDIDDDSSVEVIEDLSTSAAVSESNWEGKNMQVLKGKHKLRSARGGHISLVWNNISGENCGWHSIGAELSQLGLSVDGSMRRLPRSPATAVMNSIKTFLETLNDKHLTMLSKLW